MQNARLLNIRPVPPCGHRSNQRTTRWKIQRGRLHPNTYSLSCTVHSHMPSSARTGHDGGAESSSRVWAALRAREAGAAVSALKAISIENGVFTVLPTSVWVHHRAHPSSKRNAKTGSPAPHSLQVTVINVLIKETVPDRDSLSIHSPSAMLNEVVSRRTNTSLPANACATVSAHNKAKILILKQKQDPVAKCAAATLLLHFCYNRTPPRLRVATSRSTRGFLKCEFRCA